MKIGDFDSVEYACDVIRQRFANVDRPQDRLAYHNVAHTLHVVRRAGMIANALDLDLHHQALVRTAAAFHDVVQQWKEVQGEHGAVLRKRQSGTNEIESALEAATWAWRHGYEEYDIRVIKLAIMVTVPDWDAAHGTAYQAHLHHHSHPAVRAVALADLGGAGMDGDGFLEEVRLLFREENMDVGPFFASLRRRSDAPAEQCARIAERMLTWLAKQTAFARGREDRFEQELGDLPAKCRKSLERLFCFFQEAIDAVNQWYVRGMAMSFWELAESFGYVVPSAA